jgi:1-deoxy-D-xylulose-5-phosphate synthase
VLQRHAALLTIEEGTVVNGFGALIARLTNERARGHVVDTLGVPDRIIEHANRAEQLEECGLDVTGIVSRARALAQSGAVPAVRETA